jgi:sugar (pentulose or hexulose) kinase
MLKAILEGNAYELEKIRRLAEAVDRKAIRQMNVVGGGIKNPYWLQIKADVSGIQLRLPHTTEATLLGAALTAGVGAGVYSSFAETNHVIPHRAYSVVEPDHAKHKLYQSIFEQGFTGLQDMLLKYDEWLHSHKNIIKSI